MTLRAGEVRFPEGEGEWIYRDPLGAVIAGSPEEVLPALELVRAEVARGRHAAGFVSYEAAPGFDDAMRTHAQGEVPLLWFGIYDDRIWSKIEEAAGAADAAWTPRLDEASYLEAIARIQAEIAAGVTYQVNFAFPLAGAFWGEPLAYFRRLCAGQRGGYPACVHTGRHIVLSASPELFFELDGARITTRPMKGTRPRGRWPAEDARMAEELRHSEKDLAENIMIVDMIRNDLGRIAEMGSVRVARRFDVERYETVWQMTSTVEARTAAEVPEIFGALFPSASVTGAPKVETMKLIQALEGAPRGVYCGAVGWWMPGRRARFNVAIRTVTLDAAAGRAVYPVGSGVTWDSAPGSEYRECLDKARLLRHAPPPFELLETLLAEENGCALLEEHLARVSSSAAYFGIAVDGKALRAAIGAACAAHRAPCALRLLVARDGTIRIEQRGAPGPRRLRLGLAAAPIDPSERFLYHKTTHRAMYAAARAGRPDCDDVLLWNPQGQLTEATIGNLVLDLEGVLCTPPVGCGLLPGTRRARLLAEGVLQERILTRADLARARSIRLINAVRGWIEVEWVEE